ncbi:MAG TPA: hypothetical protein VFL76_01195 [Edaphocola sp.]|nr:hypothetical protein [Edaphocola sp.]
MKKIITLTFLSLFLMGGAGFANAQGRGHQQREHHHQTRNDHGRDQYRQVNRHADRHQYAHYRHHDAGRYYSHREKAYRSYVRRYHKPYRDYDRWYYAPRFYHHDGYVYFPGYHTYYDPYRRVYIYRDRDRWVPTPSMPSLLVGVNLGNVRVQFMSRLPF